MYMCMYVSGSGSHDASGGRRKKAGIMDAWKRLGVGCVCHALDPSYLENFHQLGRLLPGTGWCGSPLGSPSERVDSKDSDPTTCALHIYYERLLSPPTTHATTWPPAQRLQLGFGPRRGENCIRKNDGRRYRLAFTDRFVAGNGGRLVG